jgi:hypothetical protein
LDGLRPLSLKVYRATVRTIHERFLVGHLDDHAARNLWHRYGKEDFLQGRWSRQAISAIRPAMHQFRPLFSQSRTVVTLTFFLDRSTTLTAPDD